MNLEDNLALGKNTTPDKLNINQAILCLSRAYIRPVIKQELKLMGIHATIQADNPRACCEHLVAYPKAALILDWDLGLKDLNRILKAASAELGVGARPILLFCSDASEQVVSLCLEYNVIRIHSGEISRTVIASHIRHLSRLEENLLDIKDRLLQILYAKTKAKNDVAIFALRKLLNKNKDNLRVLCELTNSLIEENEWNDAKSLIEPIRDEYKRDPRVAQLWSRILMHEKKYQQATTLLEHFRDINPFHAERLQYIGECYLKVGRYRDAVDIYKTLIDIDGTDEKAYTQLATAHILDGEINTALELFKSISSPQEHASIFNNAAILCVQEEKFNQAIKHYQTALALAKNSTEITSRLVFNLGLAYYKWGKLELAEKCFTRSLEENPRFNKSLINRNVLANIIATPSANHSTNEDYLMDEHLY